MRRALTRAGTAGLLACLSAALDAQTAAPAPHPVAVQRRGDAAIVVATTLDATRATVFEALTTPDRLRAWLERPPDGLQADALYRSEGERDTDFPGVADSSRAANARLAAL